MARHADDVAKAFALGRRLDVPVTLRSGGTSLNGQGQGAGILVDVRRNFAGIRVEDDGARVRVGPGHGARPREPRASRKHERRVGPDPASTDLATVGGVIANNAGGMRCGVRHDSYSTLALAGVRDRRRHADRHRRAGRRGALRARGARAGRGAGGDPRRDPRRRGADRADPVQVRDQEHHRLPPLRVPRRRRAGRDLPPPAGGLGGHARVHLARPCSTPFPTAATCAPGCCSSRASTPPPRRCPRWWRRAPPPSS